MANEIVERVARALCAAQGVSPTENEMARATEEARAAILALAEPTAWMIDEMCGERVRHPNDQRKLGEVMHGYWRAAIGAATADTEGSPVTQAMIDAALAPQA